MEKFVFTALIAVLALTQMCPADNPVVQTIYTADPAPVVINDEVWLFTGHDEGGRFFTMHDWHCYSTKDMVNWTDHGCPLSVKAFSWAKDDAWAGQVIERNKKFYYFVPMTPKRGGDKFIGVAVSDKPEGPYKDAIGKPLIGVGYGNIDPTQFIDDDGQAYLYWGNPALKYVKLNEDMISFDEKVGIVTVPLTIEGFGKRPNDPKRATLYEEGPWFYKRNGIYYMVYAASGIPENICYATSPNATGPWTFKGVIMPTEDTKVTKHKRSSFTNHPGLVEFKGHDYFFYHTGALPGGGGFNRSVCVEEFKYNDDGTIPTVQMTDAGPDPVAHLNPYDKTEAETICWEAGVKTKTSEETGVYVTDIDDGDYIKVRSADFGAGATAFSANVASGGDTLGGGTIELHLDAAEGSLIGTLLVPAAGDPEIWKTLSTAVNGASGIHDLYFVFKGHVGNKLFNFDNWQFAKK
jgi:hypothetical protein